jgi:hypothetical protein
MDLDCINLAKDRDNWQFIVNLYRTNVAYAATQVKV